MNEGTDSASPDAEAGGGPLVQDAGSCEPTGLDGSVAPVGAAIATTGVATAVGLGQQAHLVTQSDCSYRYFYLGDDGTALLSKTSRSMRWGRRSPPSMPASLSSPTSSSSRPTGRQAWYADWGL